MKRKTQKMKKKMKGNFRKIFTPFKVKLLRKTLIVPKEGNRLPVYTLTFENPHGLYKTCRIVKGDVIKVVVPNYKPKSFSMSAERENEFDITLKIYPNGRASGYLDSILIGGEIEVFRMGVKKRQAGGEMLGIISFGVGITETLPVVAHELERGALNGFGEGEESGVKNVIFVWASKTKLDIFWHNKIKQLQKKYGQRFKFITMLSREYFSNDDGKGILDYADDIMYGKRINNRQLIANIFDHSWGTYYGGPRQHLRHKVRWLYVGEKKVMKEIEGLINENGYSVGKGFGENSYFVDDPILQKEMKRKRMNAKMNKPDTNTTIVMAARL